MVLFGQPEPVGGQIVPLLLCQWPRERLHLLQNPGGTGAHGLLIAVIGLGRDDLADPQRRLLPGVADGAQQDLLIRIGAAPDHGDLVGVRRLRQIRQAHMIGEVGRPLVAMGGLAHLVPPGCARGHACGLVNVAEGAEAKTLVHDDHPVFGAVVEHLLKRIGAGAANADMNGSCHARTLRRLSRLPRSCWRKRGREASGGLRAAASAPAMLRCRSGV